MSKMLEFIGRHLLKSKKIIFLYDNTPGGDDYRSAVPLLLYYGKGGWLMKAVDTDDGKVKVFTVKDME